MRKNDVRKWIHAVLDLLPLLVIPIFALAVRSDNNFHPIEVNYGGGYEVTPVLNSNDVNTINDVVINNVYHFDDLVIHGGQGYSFSMDVYNFTYCYLESDNDFLDEIYFETFTSNVSNFLHFAISDNEVAVRFANSDTYIAQVFSYDEIDFEVLDFTIPSSSDLQYFKAFCNDEAIIPTRSDFNIYNVQYVEGVIYNDTDIGSQMVYTLYKTCDNYFNFNNVFNFNEIYDWLTINIFNGQVPMSAFIAWNVFLYEFLMDLIFLMYALFMFFIDMCTNLIDRFTCQASGRRLK